MKEVGCFFAALAILLSDILCAVVAYNYCALQWGGRYAGYSAPPSTAFICAVPFGIGILWCIFLARLFRKAGK